MNKRNTRSTRSTVYEDFEVKLGGNLHKSQHITGSGFIVLQKFGDEFKILGLRQQGKFDFPKGHIERGESAIEAAFREAREEANITRVTFIWGLEHIIINDRLILYIVLTDQEGEVGPNPLTGIYEHEDVHWLTFSMMEKHVLDYLKPGVWWAKDKIYKKTRDKRYKPDSKKKI